MPYSTGNLISAHATDTHAAISANCAVPPGDARWNITYVALSYAGGTLSGGRLTLSCTDGAQSPTVTTLLDLDIAAAGPTVLSFNPPLPGIAGQALSAALSDGGASVVGKVTIFGYLA